MPMFLTASFAKLVPYLPILVLFCGFCLRFHVVLDISDSDDVDDGFV